jgi:putative sterol carrier protein
MMFLYLNSALSEEADQVSKEGDSVNLGRVDDWKIVNDGKLKGIEPNKPRKLKDVKQSFATIFENPGLYIAMIF